MCPRGRGYSGRRRILPALIVLLACAAPAARAQSTILTISGAPVAATPTIADYQAGSVCAGSVQWTAAVSKGGKRTDSVFVRLDSSAAMPATVGSPKALADFQYNTNAAGCAAASGWSAIPPRTAAPALLGVGVQYTTSFSGTVYFRLLLSWTADRGGATYTLPPVDFFVNRSTTVPP